MTRTRMSAGATMPSGVTGTRTTMLRGWRKVLLWTGMIAAQGIGAVAAANDVPGSIAVVEMASLLGVLGDIRHEVVLDGTIVNGNRLDLNRFVDSRSPQALQERARVIWSSRPAPVHSSERDGWLVMTQVTGPSVETLELRSSGSRTEGRWSRLSKGGSGLAGAADWLEAALPAGTHVLNRIAHEDGGRRMTTLVASTSASATDISREMVSALGRRGFTMGSRDAPSPMGDGRVFFLARGTEDLAVTISEHEGRRAVVVHWGRNMP